MILVILMMNTFSFNERAKTFLLYKSLPSLDYPYIVDHREVFLIVISTSYLGYRRFLLCKLLPFLGFQSQHQQGRLLLFREKTFSSQGEKTSTLGGKFLTLEENCHLQGKTLGKILNSTGKFSTLGEYSQLFQKVFNCGEISQLQGKILKSIGKFSTLGETFQLQGKILNSWVIFSPLGKILNSGETLNSEEKSQLYRKFLS